MSTEKFTPGEWRRADCSVEWFAVSMIADGKWGTKEEAIAATVSKLKEVCDE
jgi:hypothetical protein